MRSIGTAVLALTLAMGCVEDDGPTTGPSDLDDGPTTGPSDLVDAQTGCFDDEDCGDDQFCNGSERCSPEEPTSDSRGCVAGEPPAPRGRPPCSPVPTCDEQADLVSLEDADGEACDDGFTCTVDDVCTAGECRGNPSDGICDDEQFCTGEERCDPGAEAGEPDLPSGCVRYPLDVTMAQVEAGPCVLVQCDPGQARLVYGPTAGEPCNDGVDCTMNDVCGDVGVCVGVLSHMQCDDGKLCNGAEQCDVRLGCTPGLPPLPPEPPAGVCEAPLLCDEATKSFLLALLPAGSSCADTDACTADDTCDGQGNCAGIPVQCDAPDKCHTAKCLQSTGDCLLVPVQCFDGVPCTDDVCVPATGCEHPSTVCTDDGDQCTYASCDAALDTCVTYGLTGSCNDGIACTHNDLCVAGGCKGQLTPNGGVCLLPDGGVGVCEGGQCM